MEAFISHRCSKLRKEVQKNKNNTLYNAIKRWIYLLNFITGGRMNSFKIIGLIITLLLLNFNIVFAADPIANYSFDVDASDATGNFDGTFIGDAAVVDDADRGKVLKLTETGYVSLPPSLADGVDDFTVASWVKFNGANPWAGIMGIGMASGGTHPYWDIHFRSTFAIQFYSSVDQTWEPDGCAQIVSGFELPAVWFHFALVFTKDVGAAVYCDGVAQTLTDWAGDNDYSVSPGDLGADAFYIGKDTYNATTLTNTSIDEFKFFEAALTAEEVAALMIPNSVEEEVSLISNFQLAQNFPNPFNPETTIKFDISKNSKVKLSIFDINGQEIAVLVDDFRHAGTYSTSFNGSNLTSGVYFYRLEANGQNTTKRMLLLK